MAVPRLGDLTGGRAPGMDVLRLGAATLVIVAHSYALTNHAEPLQRFGGPEFGDIAVAVFFAISGFLVTASWVSDPRLRSFVLRRALRILPALVGRAAAHDLRHGRGRHRCARDELPDLALDLALSAGARARVLDPARPAWRVHDQSRTARP